MNCCCQLPQHQQQRRYHHRNLSTLTKKSTKLFVAAAASSILLSSSGLVTTAFSSNASRVVSTSSTAHCFALSYCQSTKQTPFTTAATIFPRKQLQSSVQMSTSSQTEGTSNKVEKNHPLQNLYQNLDPSWINQLSTETPTNYEKSLQRQSSATSYRGRTSSSSSDSEDAADNRKMRPIYNGHYVVVKPTPLKKPRLVIHSPSMAATLGFTEEDVLSEPFVQFFSGDVSTALNPLGTTTKKEEHLTWATPYALSIMGTRYTSNCPYGTGDGYGDGRAISIGEVISPQKERYEMQLKGAGPTPFCRGADGRAVLRSSIREFLASEAMHELGIRTTRALSLVVSEKGGDTSNRPWYSDRNKRGPLPTLDDPRLASYSLEQRKQIISQLSVQQKNDPDVMISEPCAITTRVSPSFVRIGHFDLFARRAMAGLADDDDVPYDTTTDAWKELEELMWHAAFRDYKESAYDPFVEKKDAKGASLAILKGAMVNISNLVADWVRVGFAQGNFNADNCLVAGRTMDYGPFGFMDEYHPLFAKWTGSGEHFGFLNQPSAGYANFVVLAESLLPLIVADAGEDWMKEEQRVKKEILTEAQEVFQEEIDRVFRSKLGFDQHEESGSDLWSELEPMMRESRTDWILFWRRLTMVMKEYPSLDSTAYGDMLDLLMGNDEVVKGSSPFYEPLSENYRSKFLDWITKWRKALKEAESSSDDPMSTSSDDTTVPSNWRTLPSNATPYERMKISNPKYVLREWMLVEAYGRASKGDENMVFELLDLVSDPYGERDGGDDDDDNYEEKYFKRAPDEALTAGGTAFMS
mmetsp:Transcript_65132/g.96274  ORF Transcript_65132/g.96274 Transcript_65132/m.96274 type:complete len:809 (-) Transcript_65132:444-2870(-)